MALQIKSSPKATEVQHRQTAARSLIFGALLKWSATMEQQGYMIKGDCVGINSGNSYHVVGDMEFNANVEEGVGTAYSM